MSFPPYDELIPLSSSIEIYIRLGVSVTDVELAVSCEFCEQVVADVSR